MGTRDKSASVDFSGVLEQEVEDALKAAAQISMGTEISEEDLSNIIALCNQVRSRFFQGYLGWFAGKSKSKKAQGLVGLEPTFARILSRQDRVACH